MSVFLTGLRPAALAGIVGLAGCSGPSVVVRRGPEPTLEDRLAADPCSVRESPDILVRNAPFTLLRSLQENLQFLKDANPVFLCGLERVELLGDAEYRASGDPKYTQRSVGLYTPADRVIHLKASAGITLTHEAGHHIHRLGFFAPTIQEFLALSWFLDPETQTVSRLCAGADCFINDPASTQPSEDWARTFEWVMMGRIETSVGVNFPLSSKETPLQKKIALIRSIAKTPDPLKGTVSFGQVRSLSASDVSTLEGTEDVHDLPASLPGETIRRIYRLGKDSIRSWIWDKRRRPFLAGQVVVFPVFQPDRKRLGFFGYDLKKNAFSALELTADGIPAEFEASRDSFEDLEVVPDPSGGRLLIGRRSDGTAIAAPIVFDFP